MSSTQALEESIVKEIASSTKLPERDVAKVLESLGLRAALENHIALTNSAVPGVVKPSQIKLAIRTGHSSITV